MGRTPAGIIGEAIRIIRQETDTKELEMWQRHHNGNGIVAREIDSRLAELKTMTI